MRSPATNVPSQSTTGCSEIIKTTNFRSYELGPVRPENQCLMTLMAGRSAGRRWKTVLPRRESSTCAREAFRPQLNDPRKTTQHPSCLSNLRWRDVAAGPTVDLEGWRRLVDPCLDRRHVSGIAGPRLAPQAQRFRAVAFSRRVCSRKPEIIAINWRCFPTRSPGTSPINSTTGCWRPGNSQEKLWNLRAADSGNNIS